MTPFASSLLAGAARKVLDLEAEHDRFRCALERIAKRDYKEPYGEPLTTPQGPARYVRTTSAEEIARAALEPRAMEPGR